MKLVDVPFRILGRTALWIKGALNVDWGPPRLRAVLATLLVHTGRPVPIETILAWAWPEDETLPQNPASTFYTYATRLRRTLRQLPDQPRLQGDNGSYWLDLDKSAIDYGQFRALTEQARSHIRTKNFDDAADCASEALDLWRGRGLDDLTSEPARLWRARVLRDEWIPANQTYIEALLGLGEFSDALSRLDELKNDHADDVALAKLHLSALHGLSRYAEETAFYLRTRRSFLQDADEQAAEELRAHHDSLRHSEARERSVSTLDLSPRQLPHDVRDFVGRHRCLAALDDALISGDGAAASVVIIDGMAGVGKTALAIHWAHRVRRHFPGGDFFINLNGFSEEASMTRSMVIDELLTALGHTPSDTLTSRSKELTLRRLFADRRALIVFDNARNTAHVKDLVALLPNCSIVVTSRQQLTALRTTTGVRRVHVDPMEAEEAIQLFSRLVNDRRVVDREDQRNLTSLCDGLPLVVAILAQHIANRPAADLAAFARRLDRRQLLVDIGEDGDGSTTAERLFLWSYRNMDPPERRLFRILGLIPGPDTGLEAIQACDGRATSDVNRSLRALVAVHLLEQPEAFDRYKLHDLIREFARHRAEEEESPASLVTIERRLLDFYLHTSRQAYQVLYPGSLIADSLPLDDIEPAPMIVDSETATRWFDRERGNLITIIRFAANRGYHEHVWRLTDAVGTFMDRRGFYDDSRVIRYLSVQSARKAGHIVGEASSLVGLGMVQVVLGDLVNARASLESALQLVEADGNERGQAATLHQLGQLEFMRGNFAEAVEFYERCLVIAQSIDDSEALCWTHCHAAEALRALGDHDEALIHLHKSEFHAQRTGDVSAQASSMVELGYVHSDRGDKLAGIAHCKRALALTEAMPLPDLAVMASACIALARISSDRGETAPATRYILRAIDLAQRTHSTATEARAQETYGDIQATSQEPAAKQAWMNAVELYERIGNTSRAAVVRARASAFPRRASARR